MHDSCMHAFLPADKLPVQCYRSQLACSWARPASSIILIRLTYQDVCFAALYAYMSNGPPAYSSVLSLVTSLVQLLSLSISRRLMHRLYTGWRKKRGHRPSHLIANIPKIPWHNCMEIGGLLQYYMLNTVINVLFKNFIALWRHLAKIPLLSFIHIVQIDLSITQ